MYVRISTTVLPHAINEAIEHMFIDWHEETARTALGYIVANADDNLNVFLDLFLKDSALIQSNPHIVTDVRDSFDEVLETGCYHFQYTVEGEEEDREYVMVYDPSNGYLGDEATLYVYLDVKGERTLITERQQESITNYEILRGLREEFEIEEPTA